jgi:hypothetical protein
MTLQELANMGEILGAAGVIASLLFVGWQVKVNTRTNRMRMHEQITQTYLSFLNAVLSDPDTFAAGLRSSEKDFADLSNKQKLFFFGSMLGLFKHYELMFVQHDQGVKSWTTKPGMPGTSTSACIFTSQARNPGGACVNPPSFPAFAISWNPRLHPK